MSSLKMQHCFNCGEEIGVFVAYHGDVLTCGKRECEREAIHQVACEQAEAQERAAEDGYERYR